jgi:hypothetical protein
VKFASTAWVAVGYLLRLSGARKLLAHGRPIRMQADRLTGGGIRTGVRLYGLDPPCIRERAPGVEYSTMPESHPLRRSWPTRDDLPGLGWYIYRTQRTLTELWKRSNPFGIL